jgi:phospholipase/carboxylesterase
MGRQLHEDGLALLAPQADRNTWYPNSFLQPVESNEPGRSSGLQAIEGAIGRANDHGIPTKRIMILGFSQGACLGTEFVARNPRRYGGVVAFSGGLIGETVDPEEFEGSLDETPAFLGCSDVDPHIPEERVHVTTEVLERLDADIEERIYEGMGHGVNDDEIEYVSGMVTDLVQG